MREIAGENERPGMAGMSESGLDAGEWPAICKTIWKDSEPEGFVSSRGSKNGDITGQILEPGGELY